jgi:outer membrane protein TolC
MAIFIPALMAACFVQAQTPAPATTHNFTVQQAVDYAAKNNAQVKNALLDINIQQQVNRGVTAAALPQVTGSISGLYYPNVPVQSFPNFIALATYGVLQEEGVKDGNGNAIVSPTADQVGFVQAQFGTKYTANAGVTLNQLLFDGQVFVGLQARRASIDLATRNAAVTQEGIKVNIHKIYYQLVVSKKQLELLDANIERVSKLKHDATEMYKNGFAEKLDIDKTDVQLNNLVTEKEKALNNIAIGYLGLKTLMGMPIKDTLVLTDTLSDADIKKDALQDSVNYADRKEFKALQSLQELNGYNIKRYQYSYIPTLALIGNYSKQAQRNKFNFFGKGDWFTSSYIGINLSVPIFDGFSKDAKIKQARFELQKTNNNLDYLKLSIDSEVEQARLKFANAIRTMDYQRKNMQLAEEVYNQTKKKFESGTGNNTEINAAQVDLKTAQTNYINALYDAVIAKTDYLKATGKL